MSRPVAVTRDHTGLRARSASRVEGEVAEAVADERGAEPAGALQSVGVPADDDVGAGVDERAGQLLLDGARARLRLDAPVQEHDDGVARRACLRPPRR